MTDTPPPPPAEPTPPAATPEGATTPPPTTPPAAPTTPPVAPAPAAGPKQSLSLASFIVGIAAFVLSWILGLGLIPGIVAVVLGFKAKKSEPGAPQWMALIGIIGGFVAIGISLIVGIISIVSILLPFFFLSQIPYTY